MGAKGQGAVLYVAKIHNHSYIQTVASEPRT